MPSALFTPLKVGDIELTQRIAMAPLTRFRADAAHVHTDLAVEYYSQRASAPGTLIITEATFIAPQAGGYPHVPGCYNDAQIAAWKKIVDAVHAKGSFIYLQLWALGRAAQAPVLAPEGLDVVSASAIPLEGGAVPRPLREDEIEEYVGLYAQAAKNFVELAGGDGVEIHSANGYLLDQFLQTVSNERTDKYGGSVENRSRFSLAVVDAVVAAVGASKTGIRLSPFSTFQGMRMPDIADVKETFSYVVNQLKAKHSSLAYIHLCEARVQSNDDVTPEEADSLDFLYQLWTPRPLLVAGGFTAENAVKEAELRKNSVVVFGRYFISNPDLVARVKNSIPFTPYDRKTFYLYGPTHPEGYTDYPTATAEIAAKA